MSYVQSNLMPNEEVIATGKLHWWAYAPSGALAAFGLMLMAGSPVFGGVMLIAALMLMVKAWINTISTELAITNRRVIAKFGFIRRSTIELLHKNVESFHVDQGVMGRILNFGTIVVNGTGGVRTPIPNIAAPLEFRRQALSTIESQP